MIPHARHQLTTGIRNYVIYFMYGHSCTKFQDGSYESTVNLSGQNPTNWIPLYYDRFAFFFARSYYITFVPIILYVLTRRIYLHFKFIEHYAI